MPSSAERSPGSVATPFDVFVSEMEEFDEQLAPLETHLEELQGEVSTIESSIQEISRERETALQNLLGQIATSDEIYRSVFELEFDNYAEWGQDKSRPSDFRKLQALDQEAKKLIGFSQYIANIKKDVPVLLINTGERELVNNPGSYSQPFESDLVRRPISIIDATLTSIEPGQTPEVEKRDSYNLAEGNSTTVESIRQPIGKQTRIVSVMGGFDHDVWIQDPSVTTNEEASSLLLIGKRQGGIGICYGECTKESLVPTNKPRLIIGSQNIEKTLELIDRELPDCDDKAKQALFNAAKDRCQLKDPKNKLS